MIHHHSLPLGLVTCPVCKREVYLARVRLHLRTIHAISTVADLLKTPWALEMVQNNGEWLPDPTHEQAGQETIRCRACGRDFFGLRSGSNLCSLHYIQHGRNRIIGAKPKIEPEPELEPEQPSPEQAAQNLIMDLIQLYEQEGRA